MLTEERISKFYEDVKVLGLKRPVAAISEATGFSKGNVSQYLNRKSPPSENFIDKFYEVFKESFKKVPHGTQKEPIGGQASTSGYVPAADMIAVLKEQNEFLRRNFEASLTGILVQGASILAHVATNLEREDEREAGYNAEKLLQLKIHTDSKIAEKLTVGERKDKGVHK